MFKIKMIGYTDNEELSILYSSARCLLYPSLYEGFGLPILEAFSSGTPVICSNTTSMPEVAGDAALMINPESITEINYATLKLLTDSVLEKNLIKKGLMRAKKFTWAKTAEETLSVYRSIK